MILTVLWGRFLTTFCTFFFSFPFFLHHQTAFFICVCWQVFSISFWGLFFPSFWGFKKSIIFTYLFHHFFITFSYLFTTFLYPSPQDDVKIGLVRMENHMSILRRNLTKIHKVFFSSIFHVVPVPVAFLFLQYFPSLSLPSFPLLPFPPSSSRTRSWSSHTVYTQ